MSKVAPDLSSVTVVRLDLAKHVFQVHCLDAGGKVVVNRALKRRELNDNNFAHTPLSQGMSDDVLYKIHISRFPFGTNSGKFSL